MKNTKTIHIFEIIEPSIENQSDKRHETKLKNIDCWIDTQKRSESIQQPPSSIKIRYDPEFEYISNQQHSQLSVHNMDTIDCALLYEKPLVLNLADDIYPGGWVNIGSSAQEESLFRRTNYHLTLTKNLYPIGKNDIIYSPNITILKTSRLELYTEPFPQMDFIACPAIKYPLLEDDGSLSEEDSEILEMKIKTILQVAIKYGYKAIVFGAMGCGAWQNPTEDVANIFKNVLHRYDGLVQNYVFAILNDIISDTDSENETESNYEVFKNILEG